MLRWLLQNDHGSDRGEETICTRQVKQIADHLLGNSVTDGSGGLEKEEEFIQRCMNSLVITSKRLHEKPESALQVKQTAISEIKIKCGVMSNTQVQRSSSVLRASVRSINTHLNAPKHLSALSACPRVQIG